MGSRSPGLSECSRNIRNHCEDSGLSNTEFNQFYYRNERIPGPAFRILRAVVITGTNPAPLTTARITSRNKVLVT